MISQKWQKNTDNHWYSKYNKSPLCNQILCYLLQVLDATIGLRLSEEEEKLGADLVEHGLEVRSVIISSPEFVLSVPGSWCYDWLAFERGGREARCWPGRAWAGGEERHHQLKGASWPPPGGAWWQGGGAERNVPRILAQVPFSRGNGIYPKQVGYFVFFHVDTT